LAERKSQIVLPGLRAGTAVAEIRRREGFDQRGYASDAIEV
jgi:hypothetical protein